MSSNMRTLIDMKKREQAQEEVRYRENQNRVSAPRADPPDFDGGFNSVSLADGGVVKNIQAKGFTPKAYANGGAVVSFGDLEPANVVGRKQISGPGMKEYNEKYAFGPGTGRNKAPQDFRKAPRTLADGGPVQDVQAKGFVPVQVSNGEFEFTPEQVANIGAAMLASKEQVPA